jgi:hypothetical protein
VEKHGPRQHSTTIRRQFVTAVAVLLAGRGPAGTKEEKEPEKVPVVEELSNELTTKDADRPSASAHGETATPLLVAEVEKLVCEPPNEAACWAEIATRELELKRRGVCSIQASEPREWISCDTKKAVHFEKVEDHSLN